MESQDKNSDLACCVSLHEREHQGFFKALVNTIPVPVFTKNAAGHYTRLNLAFESFFGVREADVLGQSAACLLDAEHVRVFGAIDRELLEHPGNHEYIGQLRSTTGTVHDVVIHRATLTDAVGAGVGIIGVIMDVTARKRAETDLMHARKLEAVGQLAAGVAHEINTPAQYVGDSVHFLREAVDGYRAVIATYREVCATYLPAATHPDARARLDQAELDADVEYLDENVPGSFERCLDGVARISSIVRAMKEFGHPDEREKRAADINRALDATLTIARNEYKYVADVVTEFGDLPAVWCHIGDINQVFLNLIINAAHTIADVVGKSSARGRITVKTRRDGESARIEITDTGTGIPESIQHRIFEPFFTTKDVGKGTGQGLAIVHSIIVERHHGTLTFETEVGRGTTFVVTLPFVDDGRPRGMVTP